MPSACHCPGHRIQQLFVLCDDGSDVLDRVEDSLGHDVALLFKSTRLPLSQEMTWLLLWQAAAHTGVRTARYSE